MQPTDAVPGTAAWYAAFAEQAAGSSPTYAAWSRAISRDAEVLARVDGLPRDRRQPNLVLAAARASGAPDGPWEVLRPWLLDAWPRVAAVARSRTTQTNEAGRCAVLLPALTRVAGAGRPVALVEVGASAGLCLYPDRYAYAYTADDGTTARLGDPGAPVVLPCRVTGGAPPPRVALPDVVARVGIDLHPLDVGDPADLAWLEALVWPEHDERRARLAAAAGVVAADPPTLVAGDLLDRLDDVLDLLPAGATPVVLHSAVLAYLPVDRRAAVAAAMAGARERRGVRWLSNEGAAVLPHVAARLPAGTDVGHRFVVALDGVPVGLAGQHGESYEPLPG
ncbi:DUF2332 domain-containing protein [Actinotalea solisilvae]|uniref:DUF2332 domain-containing protein n=1 Tax=Actinotalea solisilvae TaxID=2072922 RepID=UPI0018F1C7E7|nr:DUF2332 domain-containing protein [Actinotalea solisilvae]